MPSGIDKHATMWETWIRGYPELQGDALYWMDPTSNFTKDFVVKVVTDVVNLFYGNKNSNEAYNGERVIHLGGDETWDAWNSTALREWTNEKLISSVRCQ
mmetsp:Transcript_18584/g.15498  ORF Transcript_18584/g.15498 Transcript_18584/m.15498 type:complete len:100 (+) Transcript_18584:133-432(+)